MVIEHREDGNFYICTTGTPTRFVPWHAQEYVRWWMMRPAPQDTSEHPTEELELPADSTNVHVITKD